MKSKGIGTDELGIKTSNRSYWRSTVNSYLYWKR
jgi:hypothetical protein